VKERIGRVRAGQVHALAPQPGEGGRDHLDFLAAQAAALAGRGVESRDGDALRSNAEIGPKRPVRDAERLLEKRPCQCLGHGGERQVDGDRHHPQPRAGQHHHRPGGARKCREVLGVAGEGKAGAVVQDFLRDWIGAERGGFARTDQADAAGDDLSHGCGISEVWNARRDGAGQGMVQHRQAVAMGHRLGRCRYLAHRNSDRVRYRGHVGPVANQEHRHGALQSRPGRQCDLAADPRGIAEGQRHRRGHRTMMSASASSSWR
jgi:hypothetical protein